MLEFRRKGMTSTSKTFAAVTLICWNSAEKLRHLLLRYPQPLPWYARIPQKRDNIYLWDIRINFLDMLEFHRKGTTSNSKTFATVIWQTLWQNLQPDWAKCFHKHNVQLTGKLHQTCRKRTNISNATAKRIKLYERKPARKTVLFCSHL
jgi:hypothetical protein